MTAKRASKKSIRLDDLRSRPPIIGTRRMKQGLRGIACIALGGFGETGNGTVTHVYPKVGPPYNDEDTSPHTDYYVVGRPL